MRGGAVDRGCSLGQPHDPGPPRCDATCEAIDFVWGCSFCRCALCSWCNPELAASHGGWRTIDGTLSGTHAVLKQLACPGGCEFKLQPLHIAGWEHLSAASHVAATPQLKSPAPAAIRLQMRLASHPLEDEELLGAVFIADLASCLEAPEVRLSLVELRLGGEFAIFDLLPTDAEEAEALTAVSSHGSPYSSHTERVAAAAAAEEHAEAARAHANTGGIAAAQLSKLVLALVGDGGSCLYSGQATAAVDADAGVWELVSASSGEMRRLPLPSAEAARLTLVHAHLAQSLSLHLVFELITLAALLLAVALGWRSRRRWQMGCFSRGGQYSKALPSAVDDDDDDDDARRPPTRQSWPRGKGRGGAGIRTAPDLTVRHGNRALSEDEEEAEAIAALGRQALAAAAPAAAALSDGGTQTRQRRHAEQPLQELSQMIRTLELPPQVVDVISSARPPQRGSVNDLVPVLPPPPPPLPHPPPPPPALPAQPPLQVQPSPPFISPAESAASPPPGGCDGGGGIEGDCGSGRETEIEEMLRKLEAVAAKDSGSRPFVTSALGMVRKMRDENRAWRNANTVDEQAVYDEYCTLQQSIATALLEGGPLPSHELYSRRDYAMTRLSDSLLQQEYVAHTKAYLDSDTPPALRGMSEMLVIRMGDLVQRPHELRVQQAERMRSQAAAAAERPARGASTPAATGSVDLSQQREWNERAFWHVHNRLATALSDPDAHAATFQRLCNRHELQLVLMTSAELRSLTQAQMQAWGTSGLDPLELRAALFSLERNPLPGKPAQQFVQQLMQRTRALPPVELPPVAPPAVVTTALPHGLAGGQYSL